ncbi:MAG: hypothetical protein LBM25_06510 [Bacteroidales bacterium]|jgi:hypothetical protein|nr:hypothetical protein [Bacteroidales bacterium]
MVKSFSIFLSLFFSFLSLINAQNKEYFQEKERMMKEFMILMKDAKTDNERFSANEQLIQLFDEVLSEDKSFNYPFNELTRISNIKSEDNKFRIFTWNVISQNQDVENYGFIQVKNENKNKYDYYKLHDNSDEILNAEYTKLTPENWFGCVYYELITTKYEDKTYYTLLGYDQNNIYTKRKIIEPINFRQRNNNNIEFGANYFYKDKERRRYIFEYNATTDCFLRWDNQYYEDYSLRKKPSFFSSLFKKSRPQRRNRVKEPTILKDYMIVYEVLESMFDNLEGNSQFLMPSGEVNGFKFEKGRWHLIENVQPRNKAKKETINQKKQPKKLYNP